MKIKTSKATPLQLDWLVAKIEGKNTRIKEKDDLTKHIVEWSPTACPDNNPGCLVAHFKVAYYSPSTSWSITGPIIEREHIILLHYGKRPQLWEAQLSDNSHYIDQGIEDAVSGPTPLIAAMRAYVISKLGTEVEVPTGISLPL